MHPQPECTAAQAASASSLASPFCSQASQAVLADAQAASTSCLALSTNSKGVSAVSFQVEHADAQAASASSPASPVSSQASKAEHTDAQEVSASSPAPNSIGLSTCLVNLRSVLAKGPNFAVTPRHSPDVEYTMAIESACTKLSQQDVEEHRAEGNKVLRSSHPPKSNLTI